MAKKIANMFKTQPIPNSNKKGGVGYDNARENIDPHVKTKAINANEIWVSNRIYHAGDPDTYIQLGNDQMSFVVGGLFTWRFVEAGPFSNLTINEDGADIDFRIESDTEENAFFLDGGTGRIGIGTATPATPLEVNGITTSITFNATDEDNALQIDGTTVFWTGDPALNNVFLGRQQATQPTITTGSLNVAIGFNAMPAMQSGIGNFALGWSALQSLTSGQHNVAIGNSVMRLDTSFFRNVGIGAEAGEEITGNDNVFIGYRAGTRSTSANSVVYIGYYAGNRQTTTDNLLIIDNQDRGSVANEITKALIYGIFNADEKLQQIKFNAGVASGTLTITASSDDLDVSGVNTVFINPAAAVQIGGLKGGVAGQVLYVQIVDADQNVTLEDTTGLGTQDICMHQGLDETLASECGGWILICDGTKWYDCSHARHV